MEIFILLALIFVNGLFVMSEIALVSARKSRLENQAEKGDLLAKKALDLSNTPEKFLSAAQIGITLIAILTGVYSGERFADYLVPSIEKIDALKDYAHPIATTIIVIIVTFLSIIFGELIPKQIGLIRAERIAKLVADQSEMEALITGESLAQVASQTMQAIACTDAAQNLPILRPLIGMDKTEIIAISRKIGTFDTSIEPYEDCCTIFAPDRPKTNPKIKNVEQYEARMDVEGLVERAVAGIIVTEITPKVEAKDEIDNLIEDLL